MAGWFDLYGTTGSVTATRNYLSGFAWAENIGWLNLGQGPTNGVSYSQNEGDAGVNNDGSGGLSGYAWGENVGWIAFDTRGAGGTQVTYTAAGELNGYAWCENIGWLCFGSDIPGSAAISDQDSDGLCDLAETDSGTFADAYDSGTDPMVSDTDGDGLNDGNEVIAGTDPTTASSCLRIVAVTTPVGGVLVEWQTVYGRSYSIQSTTSPSSTSTWSDVTLYPVAELNELPEGTESVLDASPGAQRFYRVLLR